MTWEGKGMYLNMENRSLEDFLVVFLQQHGKFTAFRVAPSEVKIDNDVPSALHLFRHVKSVQKEEPTTPFHQECIDLLKDYNQNKEVLDALNLIKCSIKAAIKNVGSTEHKFSFATSTFGGVKRRDALMLLAKELPNKYDVLTDIWTFYTSHDVQM